MKVRERGVGVRGVGGVGGGSVWEGYAHTIFTCDRGGGGGSRNVCIIFPVWLSLLICQNMGVAPGIPGSNRPVEIRKSHFGWQ